MKGWRGACRWLKFNTVGAVGIVLQLTLLVALNKSGVDYLAATLIAVEVTIVHNFLWHEAWTWSDRRVSDWRKRWLRLFRFNTTTGAVSLLGNLVGMRILVGWSGLSPGPANLISVGLLGLINFLVNDRLVFERTSRGRREAAQGLPRLGPGGSGAGL